MYFNSFSYIVSTIINSRKYRWKIELETYEKINNYYVDEILPGRVMKKGIDALLKSLDPYTVYISEAQIEDFRFTTTGEYGGIGASIKKRDKKKWKVWLLSWA